MVARRMHGFLLLWVLGWGGLANCGRSSPSEPSSGTSAFLAALIASIEREPVTLPPSSILQYRYRGDLVYFRPARCCDVASDLYSSSGTLLCHPDGGFAGGDGRCPDFLTTRRDERLIWQDPRR